MAVLNNCTQRTPNASRCSSTGMLRRLPGRTSITSPCNPSAAASPRMSITSTSGTASVMALCRPSPSMFSTVVTSVLLAEQRVSGHAHRLQVLAEHVVEVVGDPLRRPAAVTPHDRHLAGRLEQREPEPGAAEHLAVHV